MDPSTIPAAVPPPISRQGRHTHMRRRELEGPNYANHPTTNATPHHTRTESVTPASPEVISNLITSLSVISRPATAHFDLPLDLLQESPVSPAEKQSAVPRRIGSFGVDYGAFLKPSSSELRDETADFDDLAAAPPVIKTAKPPSGLSPLTAQKSPTRRDTAGSLRSFLGSAKTSSRPSSRGSAASRDADVHSLGNISVERGLSPASSPTEVRKARSQDSWGRKVGRSQKGLMYMTSKERLQENEERKRGSIGNGGSNNALASSAMARTSSPRMDPFLAQVAISEESLSLDELIGAAAAAAAAGDNMSSRSIPTRDSSLRKTGANAKRLSTRTNRSLKRDSDHSAIPEEDYFNIGIAKTTDSSEERVNRHSSHREGETSKASRGGRTERAAGEGFLDPSWASTTKPNHFIDRYVTDTENEMDDGAPSPHVAQGKRRDRDFSSDRSSRRRSARSGRSTPELRVKRSSSRLKRLSGPLSPRAEEKPKDSSSETTNVIYERPPSADSIDDAVEAYLRSPRLSQKIRHPQTGRVISFSEVGDSEGSAVFCCVGMGLTRYITAFYDELALTLKLRLITPDRPGVGDSESYAEGTATPLGWPDDVYAICQALKITKFSILAHSAGAIYALATALRMPQHIRGRIHLLAPWIPPSQMSVFGASAQAPLPPTNAIPTSQKILRALPTPILKAANSSFMSATSSSITSSLPKQKKTKRKVSGKDKDGSSKNAILDKENIKMSSDMPVITREIPIATEEMDQIRPEGASPTGALSPMAGAFASSSGGNHYGGIGLGGKGHTSNDSNGGRASVMSREDAIIAAATSEAASRERQEAYDTRLTHAIWELATTGANPAVDLLVCLERRHTIGFRYVDITRPVVIHHGSRDTRVPVENVKWLGKTMRRCEVRVLEGEGHGLMASAAVMGTVLMEISKEWEDWNKVTGQAGRRDERVRRGTRIGREEEF